MHEIISPGHEVPILLKKYRNDKPGLLYGKPTKTKTSLKNNKRAV